MTGQGWLAPLLAADAGNADAAPMATTAGTTSAAIALVLNLFIVVLPVSLPPLAVTPMFVTGPVTGHRQIPRLITALTGQLADRSALHGVIGGRTRTPGRCWSAGYFRCIPCRSIRSP